MLAALGKLRRDRQMLGMPSNSAIKAELKKKCIQKIFVHQLDSSPQPPECKSAALLIELYVLWFLLECCLSFLYFFAFNPLPNAR